MNESLKSERKKEKKNTKNKMLGIVTNSQAIVTLLFSPPEIPLSPFDPIFFSATWSILRLTKIAWT